MRMKDDSVGYEIYIWSGKQYWTEECPETFRCHPIRVGVLQRPREQIKQPVEQSLIPVGWHEAKQTDSRQLFCPPNQQVSW